MKTDLYTLDASPTPDSRVSGAAVCSGLVEHTPVPIANAPDLLTACENLLAAIMIHDTAIDDCALRGADDSIITESRARLEEARDQALAAITKAKKGQNTEMSGTPREKATSTPETK